jgi:hypothetical protein
MLRVATVAPPALLEAVIPTEERYHLTLASQVLREDTHAYLNFYHDRRMRRGDYVIMDNDAYEAQGISSALETIRKAAELLIPSEIILPDEMQGPDCAKLTVERSAQAAEALRADGWKNFMAVPHGNTMNEWLSCAIELSKLEGVGCFGIAEKDALKLVAGERVILARSVYGMGQDIHLLGMMEDMSDVQHRWVQQRVRGIDGSKLLVWGINGLRPRVGDPMPAYPGRPKGYFDLTPEDLSPAQMNDAIGNVNYWQGYLSNPTAYTESEDQGYEGTAI